VMAIYTRENGQGMMFAEEPGGATPPEGGSPGEGGPKGSHLRVVK
jgi:stringent starvation protein B